MEPSTVKSFRGILFSPLLHFQQHFGWNAYAFIFSESEILITYEFHFLYWFRRLQLILRLPSRLSTALHAAWETHISQCDHQSCNALLMTPKAAKVWQRSVANRFKSVWSTCVSDAWKACEESIGAGPATVCHASRAAYLMRRRRRRRGGQEVDEY